MDYAVSLLITVSLLTTAGDLAQPSQHRCSWPGHTLSDCVTSPALSRPDNPKHSLWSRARMQAQ
jgi:hypothetical protein